MFIGVQVVGVRITEEEFLEAVDDFKEAWHIADKLGYEGRRSRHALRFALENLGIEIKGEN